MGRRKRGNASRGTDSSDIHQWQRRGWYERVEHEDQGKTLCRKCNGEVTTAQLESGKWQTRDPDGTPHRLTCGNG